MTNDLNKAGLTSPLDEKGLSPNQFEFKGAIYEVGPMERHRYFGNRRPITTIKKADAALSATTAPDGMEATRWSAIGVGQMAVDPDGRWVSVRDFDQAQSALAAMRGDCEEYKDAGHNYYARALRAEAQVKRLTEDNEALRKERDAAFAMSKCECGPEEACRNLAIDKARIKALEATLNEALDALAESAPDVVKAARAILTQENADG